MKNNLFSKATALVMGSLVLLSSQVFSTEVLAISSKKNQKLTNAHSVGESELLIAQAPNLPIQAQERIALVTAISAAFTALGDAAAFGDASSFPDEKDKIAFAQSLAKASTILGDPFAQAQSPNLTKGGTCSIINSLSQSVAVIGDAFAVAGSKAAGSDKNVANSLAYAKRAIGEAAAVVKCKKNTVS